jgi:hypothetical protein
VLDEFMLLVRRADDQNRPGVGDRFGDLFEEVLILGGAVAGALLAAPVLADGTLGVDDDLVGVFGAEMKNAGFCNGPLGVKSLVSASPLCGALRERAPK